MFRVHLPCNPQDARCILARTCRVMTRTRCKSRSGITRRARETILGFQRRGPLPYPLSLPTSIVKQFISYVIDHLKISKPRWKGEMGNLAGNHEKYVRSL